MLERNATWKERHTCTFLKLWECAKAENKRSAKMMTSANKTQLRRRLVAHVRFFQNLAAASTKAVAVGRTSLERCGRACIGRGGLRSPFAPPQHFKRSLRLMESLSEDSIALEVSLTRWSNHHHVIQDGLSKNELALDKKYESELKFGASPIIDPKRICWQSLKKK
jgi:hypothetical protein